MCDASAAVPLNDKLFVAVSDEDNVLRVYDADHPGSALRELDLSAELGLLKQSPRGATRAEEGDIEAATRIGELGYFLSSHGRNGSAKFKPARLRFFATNTRESGELRLVGKPYQGLLDDLLNEPRLAAFGLRAAAELAPKAEGGLNLEGMTERREGGVWLGFRNPIPNGRALLIPLENPRELIEGQTPRFGDPMLLDLGGLGIRGLSWFRGQYLIAAGHYDQGATSRLFTWDGTTVPKPVTSVDLRDFNPEGFFTPEGRDSFLLLSDDGSRKVADVDCKRIRNPAEKTFRGRWIKLR